MLLAWASCRATICCTVASNDFQKLLWSWRKIWKIGVKFRFHQFPSPRFSWKATCRAFPLTYLKINSVAMLLCWSTRWGKTGQVQHVRRRRRGVRSGRQEAQAWRGVNAHNYAAVSLGAALWWPEFVSCKVEVSMRLMWSAGTLVSCACPAVHKLYCIL